MKVRYPIAVLKAHAAQRPAGYLERCLASGVTDGDFVLWTPQVFEELQRMYRLSEAIDPTARPCCGG